MTCSASRIYLSAVFEQSFGELNIAFPSFAASVNAV